MHHEIIISGFGGQGVLFAGQLLAYAGLEEGRHVTWIPSYGPEMRGGTAHCTIIVSDQEIGSPIVRNPTALVVLNPPSLEKYAAMVQVGGVLVVDSSLVTASSKRTDVQEIRLPAKEIATELGVTQIANVVMLGALAQATGVVQIETLARVLFDHLGARHQHTLEANRRALQRGAEFALGKVPA